MTFSTMTAEPSTIRPKSIEPRLIRFPETPAPSIAAKAPSIESGITEATISPARRFPRASSRATTTRSAPPIRFSETVAIVLRTSSVRS